MLSKIYAKHSSDNSCSKQKSSAIYWASDSWFKIKIWFWSPNTKLILI